MARRPRAHAGPGRDDRRELETGAAADGAERALRLPLARRVPGPDGWFFAFYQEPNPLQFGRRVGVAVAPCGDTARRPSDRLRETDQHDALAGTHPRDWRRGARRGA